MDYAEIELKRLRSENDKFRKTLCLDRSSKPTQLWKLFDDLEIAQRSAKQASGDVQGWMNRARDAEANLVNAASWMKSARKEYPKLILPDWTDKLTT